MKLTSCIMLFVLVFIPMNSFAQESGEIVFSKTLIDAANPGGLTDQFQAGDHIYSMAFLGKSLLEIIGKDTAKSVPVEVFIYDLKAPEYDYQEPSEMQLETGALIVSGSALQTPYLPIDILPSTQALTAYVSEELMYKKYGPTFYGPIKYADRMSQLEAGEHTIIVRLKCNYNVVAEGTFVMTGDDYAAYKTLSAELHEFATSEKTKQAVMPKSARSDTALEEEMKAAFTASQTYKDRVKGEILRVVIIDPDWMIRRDKLTNAILHRYIRAAIAVKDNDGTCTVWQLVTFQQDYVSDAFQATHFDGIGDPYKIPCENVK